MGGEAGAAEESGAMAGIAKASKIASAFSDLAGAVASAYDLVELFSGNKKDGLVVVAEALEALTAAVTKGLQEIHDAIDDVGVMAQWKSVSDMLLDWQRRIKGRCDELKEVDSATMRMNLGESLTVVEWCEGKNDNGGLHDMESLLREMAVNLTAKADKAYSPLQLWEELIEAGTASRIYHIKGETLYSQLLTWQQSLFAMVQSATYAYNAMYSLYRLTPHPKSRYIPLDNILRDELGSAADANTTWGKIHAVLTDYRNRDAASDEGMNAIGAVPDPDAPKSENQLEYYGPDNMHEGEMHDGEAAFLLGETTSTGNSYFTGLRFADTTIGYLRYWYLQGTLATIGADGSRTFEERVSGLNEMVAKGTFPENLVRRDVMGGHQFCGGYVADPSYPPGTSLVVTGFKIELIGDVLALALQYGLLRCDALGVQTVERPDSSFHYPNPGEGWWWDKGEIRWVDKGVAGTLSRLPLTNATFRHVNDGEGHYHLYVLARAAWTGYEADAYQPAHMIRYSPQAPAAATQQAHAAMPGVS